MLWLSRTETHIIHSSQASPASASGHAHRSSAHSRLPGPGGRVAAGFGAVRWLCLWNRRLRSAPTRNLAFQPRESISAEKPVFNLRFLGSCQPAGHATFLHSPPRLRKASFCSTSRKLNPRRLPDPIATDCPGCSQMVVINDASGSFLPCFTD